MLRVENSNAAALEILESSLGAPTLFSVLEIITRTLIPRVISIQGGMQTYTFISSNQRLIGTRRRPSDYLPIDGGVFDVDWVETNTTAAIEVLADLMTTQYAERPNVRVMSSAEKRQMRGAGLSAAELARQMIRRKADFNVTSERTNVFEVQTPDARLTKFNRFIDKSDEYAPVHHDRKVQTELEDALSIWRRALDKDTQTGSKLIIVGGNSGKDATLVKADDGRQTVTIETKLQPSRRLLVEWKKE